MPGGLGSECSGNCAQKAGDLVAVLDEGGFTFCLAKIGSIGGNIMKVRTLIGVAVAAVWLTSTALADKYDDLVAKGYRWITTDGPFACASKDDLQQIIKNRSDENTLRMLQKGGVYFLIRGGIVQVVQEDKASGLSQVHWEGIVPNLWTPTKFLSKRPITNILGTISTPSQPAGINLPETNIQLSPTATPEQTATPTQGEAVAPEASPTP